MTGPLITADRSSRILTALLALALASAPVAAQTINQQIGGGIGFTFDGGISGQGSGGSPPPTCSNKLDFSQPCNSQYLILGPLL